MNDAFVRTYTIAPFSERVKAWFIDCLVTLAIMLPSMCTTAGWLNPITWFFFAGWAYFFLRDGISNGSLGKRALGLAVIRVPNGQPCTYGRSFVRQLWMLVAPMIMIESVIIFVNQDGRRLGDQLAGTQVILRAPAESQPPPRTPA